MRRLKVLSLCAQDWDATAFYRGIVPMDQLAKQLPWLDLVSPQGAGMEINEQRMMGYDAVFIQRPCTSLHEEVVRLAKKARVPLWVDYDDDLFNMQPDNPAKMTMESSGVLRIAAFCIQQANVVTCTTKALKTSLTRHNANVVVIPNAFNNIQLGTIRRALSSTGTKKVVAWRGASAHFCDLFEVAGPLHEIAERHTDWRWAFVGENFHLVTKQLPRGSWLHFQWTESVTEYLEKFKNIVTPDLLIVPLIDCAFNQAKSNVAWIEAAFAGAPVLAPDFEEWRMPGVIHYSSPQDFRVQLEKCLSGAYDLAAKAAEAWDCVLKTRLLTQVNALRRGVLLSLPVKAIPSLECGA